MDRLIFPLEAITKHLTAHAAVEEAKLEEDKDFENSSKVRYEEAALAKEDIILDKVALEDDVQTEKLVGTTTLVSDCSEDCDMTMATTTTMTTTITEATTTTEQTTTAVIESSTFKDIDTVEGFQQFADSLIATDWSGGNVIIFKILKY